MQVSQHYKHTRDFSELATLLQEGTRIYNIKKLFRNSHTKYHIFGFSGSLFYAKLEEYFPPLASDDNFVKWQSEIDNSSLYLRNLVIFTDFFKNGVNFVAIIFSNKMRLQHSKRKLYFCN